MSSLFLALWILDFIQTLPTEINVVWSRPLSGTALIFLVNRYSFLIYQCIQLFGEMPGTTSNSMQVVCSLDSGHHYTMLMPPLDVELPFISISYLRLYL